MLAAAVATLPGVTGVRVLLGEVVADAERDALVPLMTTLRDDPRFAFEQAMDICGVDWPERAERSPPRGPVAQAPREAAAAVQPRRF